MERHVGLSSKTPLRPGPDYTGLRRTGFLRVIDPDGAMHVPLRTRTGTGSTIPDKIRAMVTERDMGLCVHCGRPANHQHHRRIKGHGGDARPHTDCPCCLVSLCWLCHSWVHDKSLEAAGEGLIISREELQPYAHAVLVHGYEDGAGIERWPTCDGQWLTYEPDGGSAA